MDCFYRAYYLRPKPILRIIKTMFEDKEVILRRCRDGYELSKSVRQPAHGAIFDFGLPRQLEPAAVRL